MTRTSLCADSPDHAVPVVLPAASSPLAADLLEGPSRPATVLAALPSALYLRVGAHERVLPVLAHDALDLPTGLRLARRSGQLDWRVEAGDSVVVGRGRVTLPGATVAAVRLRRPARVVSVGCADPALALGFLGVHWSTLSLRAAEVVESALSGDAEAAVGSLVGSGRGLTPSGDDALCGVLLTLRAFGRRDAVATVSRSVAEMTSRTTSLSASLLLAAGEGYAVPEVVRLLTVLAAGPPGTPDRRHGPDGGGSVRRRGPVQTPVPPSRVAEPLEKVLAIGHSSGHDLVAGLRGALSVLASRAPATRISVATARPHHSHHTPPKGARRA